MDPELARTLSLYGDHVAPPVATRPEPELVEADGCEFCGVKYCRPVVHLTWPVLYDDGRETESGLTVGRDCVRAACEHARENLLPGGQIALDLPTWTVAQACYEAKVHRSCFFRWVEAGVFPVERDTVNRRRAVVSVHADAVWLLRRVNALVDAFDARPSKIRAFLVEHPEVAEGLVAEIAPHAIPA